MKILLDENLPRKLKVDFGEEHEVKTVREMGWLGKKNGELLGLLTLNGFEIFITLDKSLRFQQNLDKFEIVVFLLLAFNNRRDRLQPLVEQIKKMLQNDDYGKFNEVS